MKQAISSALCILALLLCANVSSAQWPAACDKDQACVGSAITIAVTNGKGAQYVDVDTSYRIRAIDTAVTFEAWIKPQQQPGKRVFVGGIWGPNQDNNDSWVLYLENNTVTFALSADNSFRGDADNTIASSTVSDLYTRGWLHVAGVYSTASRVARLYIDGIEVAQGTNSLYPILQIKKPENPALPLQIGSSNALFSDTTNFRAFKGQIDEVRLWTRGLSAYEVRCLSIRSLAGNEPGLVLYFRANELQSAQNLCDATGHGIIGKMRSGATCTASDRKTPATFTASPASVTRQLVCISDTTFTFSITDTSFCGNNVTLYFQGPQAARFTLSRTTLSLQQNVAQIVTARLNASIIGPIDADLIIVNQNRCGDYLVVPVRLMRSTEISYTKGSIKLDTLYAGCIERQFAEDSLKLCNNTARDMRLDDIRIDSNRFSWFSKSGPMTFPRILKPGDCVTIGVRMNLRDTSITLTDTLRIVSDEACPGSGSFAITGRIQEVLGVLTGDGRRRLDSMYFNAVCPGQISDSRAWQYRRLSWDTVRITSIQFSAGFFGFQFGFPIVMAPPIRAYPETWVRSKPTVPGPLAGTMKVTAEYRGCTIEKTVYLNGRGISVDVDFAQALVGFGAVAIGQAAAQNVPVTNKGDDQRKMSSYLKMGDVFTITGNKSFTILPGQTQQVQVTFRPREPKLYRDTLCIFDEECYGTICVPVEGSGVFEALSFVPPYSQIDDVIGCDCKTDTIVVRNVKGISFSILSDNLVDASGKFSIQKLRPGNTLQPNDTYAYVVRYCPDDVNGDRADEAFIDISLSDGQIYHLLLRANSVAPKAYVTDLTAYGTVEVGWQKVDRILVENTSSVPIRISRLTVPAGFTILSSTPPVPATLAPRDSMWVDVEFRPTQAVQYGGQVKVELDTPCAVSYAGQLTGRGKVVKLLVPLSFVNYGIVKPCDCATREIPLPNESNLIPIVIDSIWVDGMGVSPLAPSVFSWKSRRTGGQLLPYSIPPNDIDTLVITFCPNIPATQLNQVKNDTLHIAAHSPGWAQEFRTLLSGRRELNFQPDVSVVTFPATRVDTSAPAQTVTIGVPNILVNPSGDSVVITAVSFRPDQKVFSAVAANGAQLPWVIRRGEQFKVLVNFYPRAPKDYVARMQLHTSYPCAGVDTTILVRGTGFAPAFGLQMAFDTANVGRDTTRLTTCDTLVLPVMITRGIPQPQIDMYFRIQYDSLALKLLDATSPFSTTVSAVDTGDGARVVIKDAWNAEAGTIAYVRFAVIGGPTAFPILLDDIDFDSDSLVFFKIVAGIDKGYIIIEEPLIGITASTDFDTVNIKDCLDRQVIVRNPGTMSILFDSLSALPKWHEMTSTSATLPAWIAPGDSVIVTLRFCPRDEEEFYAEVYAVSSMPCPVFDTMSLHSFGYAPPFPFKLSLRDSAAAAATISGTIADTISVPIYVDRAIPQTPIDMKYTLDYNKRALQYFGIASRYTSPTVRDVGRGVEIDMMGCDSVMTGEIARVTFVLAVPDSIISQFVLEPRAFTSDSIFWVKPRPVGDTSVVTIGERCNISRMVFREGGEGLSRPMPNPATSRVKIEFQFVEDADARLTIFDARGNKIESLLSGEVRLAGGRYAVEFNVDRLPAGHYFYVLDAGVYHAVERMVVIR